MLIRQKSGDIMRQRIRLDTMQDIQHFVDAVSQIQNNIVLTDDDGHCVSAKSVLGVAYSKLEWREIFVVCDEDISSSIVQWIV